MAAQPKEFPVFKISGIGYVSLISPDVQRMRAHYEETLGLAVTSETSTGEVWLSTGLESRCLVLRPGRTPALDHVALLLSPGSEIDGVARRLRAQGIDVAVERDGAPGVEASIGFQDHAGNALRLVVSSEEWGPGPGRSGIVPEKLGHVAHRIQDPAAAADWYQSVLGFKVADWIGDYFVFLRTGPDHHTLNFIRANPPGTMHHIGFQLSDGPHLLSACDELAAAKIPLIWGPGRHGAGHNLYAFYRDPDDNIVELFCQLDLMLDEDLGYYDPRPWHSDVPQWPKVWDDLAGANLWGLGPPDEMRRAPVAGADTPLPASRGGA